MAEELGLVVDEKQFERLVEEAKQVRCTVNGRSFRSARLATGISLCVAESCSVQISIAAHKADKAKRMAGLALELDGDAVKKLNDVRS